LKLAPAGSTLWLLRHDLRLAGRDMRALGRGSSATVGAMLLATIVVLHGAGFLMAPLLARLRDGSRTDVLVFLTIAVGGAFTLFLSKAISESVDALYQRGDLELLLSSPMPMRRVLTTRLLAIAVIAGFLPILMVVPVVDGMLLRGSLAWAGIYPVLIALSLAASASGASLTFGLLLVLGARWTRLAARIIATLLGATSFLATQLRVLLPDGARHALWRALTPSANGHGWPQWWPARAMLGEPWPMIALLASAVIIVILVSRALGHVYAAGVLNTLALPRRSVAAGVAGRFKDRLGTALVRKEFRLLLRHPGLAAQVFYQFVFLVPGAIALMRVSGASNHTPAGVVFLTALMTGRIARLLVAPPFDADQAQALAATAPVPPSTVLHAKLVVSFVALAVVGGLPIAVIGARLPLLLPAACLACGGAAATRLWVAARRRPILRRPGMQGRMRGNADGLLGVMIDVLWGVAGSVVSAVS
jgi:ABC-2 type transport system permease protein